MSKRNKQAEINATKNKQGKPKLSDHLSQNDDLSGQIRSTGELSRIDYPDTVNNQTAVLGDSRLQKIQRQTIANQIGQTQGNRQPLVHKNLPHLIGFTIYRRSLTQPICPSNY